MITVSSRMLGGGELRTTYHLGMDRWTLQQKVLSSFMLSSDLSVISTKLLCKMAPLKLCANDEFTYLACDAHATYIRRFSVLFSYHKANTLQLSVLSSIVDSISKFPIDPNRSDSAERTLLLQLFNELQEFLTLILNVLNNHLVNFDIKSSSSVENLKEHLLYVCSAFPMATIPLCSSSGW